ncbi:MAG: hypothetical protein JSW54_03050 [Fidelibacterota bacterium]|nr:MAG: hypothetical protein JSW54_03050 [Candidatus Neomarinimicrobiota bacterium]
MGEKTIAVRLNPQLEKEGRGICDPEDPRNNEVITPRNYGARGYLRVHPSGFIQAQIQAGVLIRVPDVKVADAGKADRGAAKSGKTQPARRSREHKR